MLGRIPLRVAAMAALLLTLSITLAVNSSGAHADGDEDQAPPVPEKGELKYPNLGSHLDQLVARVEEGESSAQDAAGETAMHRDESVAVTIHLSGHVDDMVEFLEENGGDPRNVGEDYIEAYVPVALLGPVSEQPAVIRVREIVPPQPSQLTQQVIGNGPAVHGSLPWNQAGYTGQGVKVGIIDDFRGFSALGGIEVPATVVARCYTGIAEFSSNLADCERVPAVSPQWTQWPECLDPVTRRARRTAEHGTWVAESLLDIAPGASLYLANPGSKADLQATVDWMASQGVTVINYSVGWTFDGPGDGTSPLSVSPLNTVDRAVDRGITWVNSAGNGAEDTWFDSYSDPDGDGVISFGGAAVNDEVNVLPLRACRSYRVQLRWEDSWGGANTDLNLYLYDTITRRFHPTIRSVDPQSGGSGHQPFEWIAFYSRAGTNGLGIVVDHHAGPAPEWIQVVSWSVDPLERHTLNGSIGNPAESAHPGMLAVGAAPWFNVQTIEPFSSRGPTPDGRTKPDIVGADCGATALYPLEFSSRLGGNCGFAGTSQAAPHVAGMAALVRERFPDYTPAQVASYLKDHAEERGAPGFDNTWGHGFAALPPIFVCSNNPGLKSDCARLLAGRDTLAGAGTLNWSASVPIEDWDGVKVGGSPLRVTELQLFDKGLTGEIPAELGGLSDLQELNLTRNQLTGTIPVELGQLANLTTLALGGNQLNGTIPTQLGGGVNLEELYLWENELTGSIPAELGNLTNLRWLSLGDNQLSGEIPTALGTLARLEHLRLYNNQLTGPIPTSLGSLANLEELNLARNQLTGEIPPELARAAGLEILALGGNRLTGTVPTWLGNLTNLEELYLWGNELTGTVPTELGSLANLVKLQLSENQLTGEIPSQLGNLARLQRLSLSDNQLTGPIPTSLGSLANLEELHLTRNRLTGEIPPELARAAGLEILALGGNRLTGTVPTRLGNLTNLEELYLWGNELTGTVPTELGSLANLVKLQLSGNQLTGEIPSQLGNLTNLEELYLWDNELSGTIPQTFVRLTKLEGFVFHNNLGLCAPVDRAFQEWLGSIAEAIGSSCAPVDFPGDREVLVKLHGATGGSGWRSSAHWLTDRPFRDWHGVVNDAGGRVTGLFLYRNQLSGTIPPELGNLSSLERLSLHQNRLTGEIPAELGSLVNLRTLSLSGNQLTGEIPAELGRLANLAALSLSGNQLTGCVPASLRDVEENDFAQLGLTFCTSGDPLIARYDANGNGTIDRSEVIKAINDYLSGVGSITRADVIRLINLYLSGPPSPQQSEASEESDAGGRPENPGQPFVENSPP